MLLLHFQIPLHPALRPQGWPRGSTLMGSLPLASSGGPAPRLFQLKIGMREESERGHLFPTGPPSVKVTVQRGITRPLFSFTLTTSFL